MCLPVEIVVDVGEVGHLQHRLLEQMSAWQHELVLDKLL